MDVNWRNVRSDIPYVFYLPPKEAVPVDKGPKDNKLTEFVAKVDAGTIKLLSILTVDFPSKDEATYVIVNTERKEGKKVIKESFGLDAPVFFKLKDAPALWDKFLKFPKIAAVHACDSYIFSKIQKVEVRYEGAKENTIIYVEHFMKCPAAHQEWEKFADRTLEKRDVLISFEKASRAFWEEHKLFQLDAVDGAEKWVGTFPYPYMNGALHLGHSFTIAKIDFAAGYHRLKGKKALFPFSFHCTGMPIKACADKLKREMQLYGNPPQFPGAEPVQKEQVKEVSEAVATKRVTAKAAQKGSASKFQWQIMESLGVPQEEIPKFAEANFWLNHFPPRCMADLKSMGSKIDWRRSFITTDASPYYDAFVRWQFNRLKKLDKINYGKRPTIFSPLDGQACLDHERQEGEGVGVAEYTVVKQELLKPYPACLKSLEDTQFKVYLAPATLRPETMYGQTNCWILPTGEYGAYQINATDVFVMTPRAARNCAFQELSVDVGVVKELAKFKGSEIIGAKIHAPLSKYSPIYVLPMFTIKTTKTTGVVTSVPSDSPDDYAAFMDIKNKLAQMKEKFGVTEEMIANGPTPIIKIESISDMSAVTLCEELKIISQNDALKLAEAKDRCYLKGFTEGVMLVGEHAGKPVQDAKPLVRKQLIDSGLAVIYREPDGLVISRSNDECVVSLCFQWYLDYGETEWQKLAFDCLEAMNTFDLNSEVRNQVKQQLKIIHQWACSRSYGLGTRIPWDEQYLVESLSDSTIYMAYYTISHLLQGENNLDGKKVGPAGIKVEQMTDPVFDYIFGGSPMPETTIPKETLELMRKEFRFWYPIDLRATGKDLLPNHILFWIYNHVAMVPKDQWPRGLKANGWLLLNGEKMAKRTGNFVTLEDGCIRYGADAMRFTFANSGDGMDDPNFTVLNVDTAILSTHTFWTWVKEMMEHHKTMKTGEYGFAEKVFDAEINRLIKLTDHVYARLEYREVLNNGFFGMCNARDEYVKRCETTANLHSKLIDRFIRAVVIMLAPITSHTSEHIWRHILNEQSSVFNQKWPETDNVNTSILHANAYLNRVIPIARSAMQKHVQKSKKQPTSAKIYVATHYPQWHQITLEKLKEYYLKNNKSLEDVDKANTLNAFLTAIPALKAENKKVMGVMGDIRKNVGTEGESIFDVQMPFDEKATLIENIAFLKSQLGVSEIGVELVSDVPKEKQTPTIASATPGKPMILFE